MALRRPSQHTIDLYNQLVEQQNKVRKQLLRIHKRAEETIPTGRLPALIIPKKARKVRLQGFYGDKLALKRKLQAFWDRYRKAKAFFGQGIKSYLARTVKDGYMKLWRDRMLIEMSLKPEGNVRVSADGDISGFFTAIQLKEMNSDQRRIAEIYNSLYRLSPEVFLALLYENKIIQFQFIYEEMKYGVRDKENSWSQQQAEALDPYRSRRAQAELLMKHNIISNAKSEARYADIDGNYRNRVYSGEHTAQTITKAEKRYNRSLKKGGN